MDEDVQGNVQPTFIGVFDTVAALGNAKVSIATGTVAILLALVIGWMIWASVHWTFWGGLSVLLAAVLYWYARLKWSQWKYFSPDEQRPLKVTRLRDWPAIWKYGHHAKWNLRNYDRWLDSDVRHARHALSIDEHRKNFPRVKWAMAAEAKKTEGRAPQWLKQVWFAGCHSDVGGSYPEPESRLSDIALQWMLEELKECVPDVQINGGMLYLAPDSKGMQHEETYMFELGPLKWRWPRQPRMVDSGFQLHPSVMERLKADAVSHLGEMRAYRPEQLRDHPGGAEFFEGRDPEAS